MQVDQYDVIILGSGAAGLALALELRNDIKVAIISKEGIEDTASYKAQGGIAAVINKNDCFQSHIKDTVNAGGLLCDLPVVQFFVEQGPNTIRWLTDQGVLFDRMDLKSRPYDLHREGGHSKRRILHVKDETGKYIVKTLFYNVQKNAQVDYLENCIAIDLLVHGDSCAGCLIFDKKHRSLNTILAKAVVLATGGASAVYSKTSNEMATGDGIAMAYRAGCRIKHMEFCQFHPTCFNTKGGIFLMSETMRGEGGRLTKPSTGERFMFKYDKRGELAPRDVVARAMTLEMERHHFEYINLDISHRSCEFIKAHFPKIYDICLQNNIDITREPIRVFPAAHYTCGGVATDTFGQTTLGNLFAIGEVACTNLHGANRLASNSLLECIVSALNLAKKINMSLSKLKLFSSSSIMQHIFGTEESHLPINEWRRIIRRIMWSSVGIIRSNHSLLTAKSELFALKAKIEHAFSYARLSEALIEVRNLAEVACLIVQSALCRKENRGAHYNIDNENNGMDEA